MMKFCMAQDILAQDNPPLVIMLELHPGHLDNHGFPGGAPAVLEHLYDLGYTDISHSGCGTLSKLQSLGTYCSRGNFLKGLHSHSIPGTCLHTDSKHHLWL